MAGTDKFSKGGVLVAALFLLMLISRFFTPSSSSSSSSSLNFPHFILLLPFALFLFPSAPIFSFQVFLPLALLVAVRSLTQTTIQTCAVTNNSGRF